jgi:hypothetical protein
MIMKTPPEAPDNWEELIELIQDIALFEALFGPGSMEDLKKECRSKVLELARKKKNDAQ